MAVPQQKRQPPPRRATPPRVARPLPARVARPLPARAVPERRAAATTPPRARAPPPPLAAAAEPTRPQSPISLAVDPALARSPPPALSAAAGDDTAGGAATGTGGHRGPRGLGPLAATAGAVARFRVAGRGGGVVPAAVAAVETDRMLNADSRQERNQALANNSDSTPVKPAGGLRKPPSLGGFVNPFLKMSNAANKQVARAVKTAKGPRAAPPDRLGAHNIGTLHVTVHSCENLKIADGVTTGLSDPYVVIDVDQAQQPRSSELRTPFIAQTLNPVWSSSNQFSIQITDADARLRCHVYDDDGDETPDYLGGISMAVNDYIKSAQLHAKTAFDLGACPDPKLVAGRGVTGISGRVFLSLFFEAWTAEQQKHPLGWVEIEVLSATGIQHESGDGAEGGKSAKGAVAALTAASQDMFVQVHMSQPGPAVHAEQTPCVMAAAGEAVWGSDPTDPRPSRDNRFSLEVRSSMASLVLQVRSKNSMFSVAVKSASEVIGEVHVPLYDYVAAKTATGPVEIELMLGPHNFQNVNSHRCRPRVLIPFASSFWLRMLVLFCLHLCRTPLRRSGEAGHFDEQGRFIRAEEQIQRARQRGAVRVSLNFKIWVPPPPPIGELLVKPVMAEGLIRADNIGQNDTCESPLPRALPETIASSGSKCSGLTDRVALRLDAVAGSSQGQRWGVVPEGAHHDCVQHQDATLPRLGLRAARP